MSTPRPRDAFAEVLRACAAVLRACAAALGTRVARVSRRLGNPILKVFVRLLPPGRVLFAVGLTLFILGWAAMPALKIIEWVGGSGLSSTEFPFSDLRDVAVDSRGRIYVADGFHCRVQRYSPTGAFELGWFVPTKGTFALRTSGDDQVRIAVARGNKLLTYDSDGELLDARYRQKEDRYSEFASETETTGPYAVRRGLRPHVIDSRTGEVVLATPWPQRLIAWPVPSMLYLPIGLAIACLGDWKRRRQRPTDPGGTPDPTIEPVGSRG